MSLAPIFRALVATGLCIALVGCGAAAANHGASDAQRILSESGGLDNTALARLERGMHAGGLALAARFDPLAHADVWDRPAAWRTLDLAKPASLPWGTLSQADAAAVNALLPVDDFEFAPAQPFYLRAKGAERDRAILCMTQAVYYEAALEPLAGQQAVAQTVINRMRHPDFPKSICGVVFQGSQTPITCQFSFACDGSLARAPIEPYWSRAKEVAEAALDGFVAKSVGPAVSYHADYVFPRWGAQMVKIVQLGAHIFYRFPGPAGAPQILNGRYAGHELAVSTTGPSLEAIAAAKAALAGGDLTLADLAAAPITPAEGDAEAAAPPPTPLTAQSVARFAAASAPMQVIAAPRVAIPGETIAGRRVPTRQEIARVNARLPPMAPTSADDGPMATAGGDGR